MKKKTYGVDSDTKKDYNAKYLCFVGFKLFRAHGSEKYDQELIDFLDAQTNKSETIKQALREYMTNHPAD